MFRKRLIDERALTVVCAALVLSACASAPDPRTADWWATTEVLSSDAMEGRDTGSPGHDRANQAIHRPTCWQCCQEPISRSPTNWYQNRYHAPQDDITTPIDFAAQAKFHRFYFALAEAVADADEAPQWLPNRSWSVKGIFWSRLREDSMS